MISDVLRRPRLFGWKLPSIDRSGALTSSADDLPVVSDAREGLPRAAAVLAGIVVPVVAITAPSEIGNGFSYRDVVALLFAYAIASVALVRLPWSRLPADWSIALIGLQLLFVVSLTTLTGGGESPYFALYAPVLAIAGWHLAASTFVGVVVSVGVLEVWRALTINVNGSLEQLTIGLPFFAALGLLSLVTARRLTAALVLLRQDQARTSDTLIAVGNLAGDLDADPLPELAQAAERVFDCRAIAIAVSPTTESSRGSVVAHRGGTNLTVAVSGAATTYGLLHLERTLPFSSNERRLVAILADTVGRAIDAHRLFDEIRQASERDALTGLLNRRSLDTDLKYRVATALATGQTVTVAFADIVGLKSINDARGHEVGDRLIRRAGRAIAGAVRFGDRVYRSGGDEFVVVAFGLSPAESARLSERLRNLADKPARRSDDPDDVPFGLSVGIAIGAGPDLTPEQLLADADREMYRSRILPTERAEAVGPVA